MNININIKRFLSRSIFFIFCIFIFASNFDEKNNSCNADNSSGTTFIPIVNYLKDYFNGHAIWWQNDDWDADFDNHVPEGTTDVDAYKILEHGIDGYSAFYTSDPKRNGGVGGLPNDGRVIIGGVPFVLQQNSQGKDCFRFNKDKDSITDIPHIDTGAGLRNNDSLLGYDTDFVNIYVMGLLGGGDTNKQFSIKGKHLTTSWGSEKWGNYSYDGTFYDYFANESALGNNSYTQDYYVRKCSKGDYRGSEGDYPKIQCCKISTTNNRIQNIGINFTGVNQSDPYQFLCIFALTAEIKTDLVASDITYNKFTLSFNDSNLKSTHLDVYTDPSFSENSKIIDYDAPGGSAVEYYISNLEQDSTFYCRVTKTDGKYSYITVRTLPGKRLRLKAYNTPITFNGSYQQLINSVKIIDAGTDQEPTEIDVSNDSIFKDNIYLRINNDANEISSSYDTGWQNLNNLPQLNALNVGTYYLYYFIDTDYLYDYISTALSAEIVTSN